MAALDSGYGDPPRVLDGRVERHVIFVPWLHFAKREHAPRRLAAANPDLNAVAARKVLRFLFAEARNVEARCRKVEPILVGSGLDIPFRHVAGLRVRNVVAQIATEMARRSADT